MILSEVGSAKVLSNTYPQIGDERLSYPIPQSQGSQRRGCVQSHHVRPVVCVCALVPEYVDVSVRDVCLAQVFHLSSQTLLAFIISLL